MGRKAKQQPRRTTRSNGKDDTESDDDDDSTEDDGFGGIYSVVNIPLGYYSGFVLPHRFNQSNQTLKDWIIDQIKGLAVGAPIGLLLLELLYLALRATGDLWWLWAAGGMLVFSVLLSNLAPILIMPLFNRYVPLGDEHQGTCRPLA